MKILTRAAWNELYRAWRTGKAHWSKPARARAVRGCQGKVCYESREEAVPEAKKLAPIEGYWISIYGCRICGGFHVGNTRLHMSSNNG